MIWKPTRTKKLGRGLMIIGLVLIAAALSLAGYNEYTDYKAKRNASQILNKMSDLVPGAAEILSGSDIISDINISTSNSDEMIVTEELSENETVIPEMDTIIIDGQSYIGFISVPSLELSLPVMSEYVYENLKIAPNRYSGSIYTDDLVIAGHNYKSHFNPLQNVEIGSEVLFTDVNGISYLFTVTDREVLEPEQIDDMITSDYDLTLFTCTYGGMTRLAVRCLYADK